MSDCVTDSTILSFQITRDYVAVFQGDGVEEYEQLDGIALVRKDTFRVPNGIRSQEPFETENALVGLLFDGNGEEFFLADDHSNYLRLAKVHLLTEEQKAVLFNA